MGVLALFEMPTGFALFDVTSSGYKTRAVHAFHDSSAAVDAMNHVVESTLSDAMKGFLKDNLVDKGLKDKLMVMDKTLAGAIHKQLKIPIVTDFAAVLETMRDIRLKICDLVDALTPQGYTQASLGLSHTLSRFKLKFSPEKVDLMVIHAVALLDDLDKELNTYSMRVKEWYGWHFPELAKLISDNVVYAKIVLAMKQRTNAPTTPLEDILPEDQVKIVRDAAVHSMGTEIPDSDLSYLLQLANEVVQTSEYRAQLGEYLKNRMQTVAPNLTSIVGELVGARLISHAGSLLKLAKYPASTVQILGAEKALFRALKSRTNPQTPKYGLIFHASLVGQAAPKNKGKISRVLAAKASLCSRLDSFQENTEAGAAPTVGMELRERVEARLRMIENNIQFRISGTAKADAKQEKYEKHTTVAEAAPAAKAASFVPPTSAEEAPKKKKKKKRAAEEGAAELADAPAEGGDAEPEKKKKKKKKKAAE